MKRKFSASPSGSELPAAAAKSQKQPRLDSFFRRPASAAGDNRGGSTQRDIEDIKGNVRPKVDRRDSVISSTEQTADNSDVTDITEAASVTGGGVSEDKENHHLPLYGGGNDDDRRSSQTGQPDSEDPCPRLEKKSPSESRVAVLSAGHRNPPTAPHIIFDDFASFTKTATKHNVDHAVQPAGSGGAKILFDDFSAVRLEKRTESPKIDEDFVVDHESSKPVIDDLAEIPHPLLSQESGSLKITFIDGAEPKTTTKKSISLVFSMARLRESIAALKLQTAEPAAELKFKARISPEDNSSAEAELDRQLSKSDFAAMDIFGQFNLGFLIVGLRQDLFIVDQHATDEKYNFETLQRTTVIGSQRMVQPQRLELTAVGESIVMDHLAVFQRNGFQFLVEPDKPPTQRVSLSHLPTREEGTLTYRLL